MRTAVIPYRTVCRPGDQAVILADTDTEPLVWEVCAAAAESLGVHANVIVMPPLARDYDDPPPPVMAAIEAADAVHYVTSLGIVHSRFGRRISRAGKRKIISEGITPEMFVRGAVLCDPARLNEMNRKINRVWDGGREVRITTSCGTDLSMRIERRSGFVGADNKPKQGFDIGTAPTMQFPGGEAPIAPLEDTAEGVLVVDRTMHYPRGLLREPIRLEIHKGTITRISGGDEARQFERWLASYGDADGYRVCEVSCGTNEEAVWMGNMRQDRFVLGSMHLGFGMNADVGGSIDSNIHYDAIFSRASLNVDGRQILQDGRCLI
jgi:leucyl aminopeptidase (aminopeptidase T)